MKKMFGNRSQVVVIFSTYLSISELLKTKYQFNMLFAYTTSTQYQPIPKNAGHFLNMKYVEIKQLL